MRSKTIRMGNVVVSLLLVLGAGAAQAVDVIFDDPGDETKATSIVDLVVDGTTYNVISFSPLTEAPLVYGPPPGEFVITEEGAALDAVAAMVSALTDQGAESAGEVGFNCPGLNPDCQRTINLCYASTSPGMLIFCETARTLYDDQDGWAAPDADQALYVGDSRNYALLEEVPEPGATLSMVAALVTLSVVRRRGRAPTNFKAESPST
jgi:hypothetical protein